MKIYQILVFISLFIPIRAILGFDSINPISTENFTCFLKEGYEFYIGRIYKSIGEVDVTVMENIKNAKKAGFNFIDGYIFPCLMTKCKTAKEQIQDTLNFVQNEGVQIGRLWIDVQDGDIYWELNQSFNQAFILEAVKEVEAMGLKVGIYTNKTHWEKIVGNEWNAVANKPLWWDNWSGKKSFDDFVPFGGWKFPDLQQFNPEYKSSCGVVIDESWYP
uniref:Uncharacterized protein n=1 Tax=Panagrolaimus davidi TaxID=227884 RepID=A0A914PY73_9BILA